MNKNTSDRLLSGFSKNVVGDMKKLNKILKEKWEKAKLTESDKQREYR